MIYRIVETALGYIPIAGADDKLAFCHIPLPTREAAIKAIEEGIDGSVVEDNAGFADLAGRLVRYASGENVDFSDVSLELSGISQFWKTVLLKCQKIPYGSVVTYSELAGMAGNRRAARAAGSAMANNPVPIIVPCHRVIAAGHKLGGFGQGLEWKSTLLKLEGIEI